MEMHGSPINERPLSLQRSPATFPATALSVAPPRKCWPQLLVLLSSQAGSAAIVTTLLLLNKGPRCPSPCNGPLTTTLPIRLASPAFGAGSILPSIIRSVAAQE